MTMTTIMEENHNCVKTETQKASDEQPFGSVLADTEPFDSELSHSEIPNQQLCAPELAYSHSDDQVNAVPQPMSTELVHIHSNGSKPVGEYDSTMYQMETIDERDEFIKTEHDHPEIMNEEADNTDLEEQLNSELMHELQCVDSEFDNTHTIAELDTANMQLIPTETPEPESQPVRRRKRKSIVWEHFTIETISPESRRACCKVCKQSFAYSTGSKVAGTSHLKRHIARGSCPTLLRQQITPYAPKTEGTEITTKRRYKSSNSQHSIFNQDSCRLEIARMIIMHEYPLQMVEHTGFASFVQNLQPQFDMVNFNTVQGDCVATFLREKQNLQKIIDNMSGKICLSADIRTSCQTTGYVFLHCQFIDQDFKLQRRLLNVVMEPFPDSDEAFSHAVSTCLSDWNLNSKLCSVTFNHPLTDTAREKMMGLLSVTNPNILNGQLLLGSCLARALTAMALGVLTAGQDLVRKIRSNVKYVKSCNGHGEKFTLDDITKWNTTYDMLVSACELKDVFSCLEISDLPTIDDWKKVESMCMYLRVLMDTTNFLVEKNPPATCTFFLEVWKIHLLIIDNIASDVLFVSTIAGVLQERFVKYWKESFLVMAIAVAMDPRYKMKLVEYSLARLFGEDEAPKYITRADEGIHGLYNEYKMTVSGEVNEVVSNGGLSDFDMYIMETTSQQMKSELDEYLEESLLPRMQEIDVIGWWKMNRIKYPTLSKMARDVLSIPLASVGPDNVFDTVSREVDLQWSSLKPETMEALMCSRDWLSI